MCSALYQRKNARTFLALIPEPSGKRFKVLSSENGLSSGGGSRASRRGHEIERCIGSGAPRQAPGAGRWAALLDQGRPGPSSRSPSAHDVAAVDVHDDVEVVIAPLLRPEHRVISQDHTWFGTVAINSGFLIGMGALHRHLGGHTSRRAAWPPPRERSNRSACRRPRRLAHLTTSIGRPRGRARRFYTDVLSQLIGRLQEFVPSSRLIPRAPQLFPARR